MVKIPDNRSLIPAFVFKTPVINPANVPAKSAAAVAKKGLWPLTISEAATAAPKGKLPSTVKSENFSILKVIYNSRAIILNTRPCSKDLKNKFCKHAKTPRHSSRFHRPWSTCSGMVYNILADFYLL